MFGGPETGAPEHELVPKQNIPGRGAGPPTGGVTTRKLNGPPSVKLHWKGPGSPVATRLTGVYGWPMIAVGSIGLVVMVNCPTAVRAAAAMTSPSVASRLTDRLLPFPLTPAARKEFRCWP